MTPAAPSPTRTRTATIVIAGDDVYEDLFGVASVLQELLTAEGFAARTVMGLSRFAARWPADDLVVVCSAVGEFTAAAQRELAASVRAGLGAIFVHATAVLDPERDADAIELIGARYESHGPQPHESRFRVELSPTHPITAGVDAFDIDHEHYRLVTATDAALLAWRSAATHDEPLLTAREVGAGRVCYLQLGHDARAFGEPELAFIVRRAARWATRSVDEERRSA